MINISRIVSYLEMKAEESPSKEKKKEKEKAPVYDFLFKA